jgi:hypothetical protein
LQDARIAKVDDALILVFLQQRFKHGAGLWAVFCEDIPFTNIIGTLAAGESWLVEGYVANKIERVEVLPNFISKRLQGQPLVFEFFDDGLLALRRLPALQEVVRLANLFFKALLVKSFRLSVMSFPFSSRYSTRSATMVAPTPST